jgi:hypothetical protein
MVVVTVFLSGCGLDFVEPKYLALLESSPSANTVDVDPWGPYKLIFNQPISMYSDSLLQASFPAYWRVSGETLFVYRTNGIAGFGEKCTVDVPLLVREDGEIESINSGISFRTGNGEREDNGSIHYPDTLRTGTMYGELDNSSAGSDEDYYVVKFDSATSGHFTVTVLNDKALYFSSNYSSKTYKAERGKNVFVSFASTRDTTKVIRSSGMNRDTLYLTDESIICRLGCEDMYNGSGVRLQCGSRYVLLRK